MQVAKNTTLPPVSVKTWGEVARPLPAIQHVHGHLWTLARVESESLAPDFVHAFKLGHELKLVRFR